MSDLDEFYAHTVVVETQTGTGAYGDIYATPTIVDCFVDGARSLVRDKNGQQVVAQSTLYTDKANEGMFTPDSRVTYRGQAAYVIVSNLLDSGELELPDHLVVSLR